MALQYLDLDLTLTSWPLQLKTTAPWTHPLLTLRGSGLHRVRIVLRHHMFAENRLMMTARSLENLMMTAKGREQRDVEEALEAVREFEKKEAQKASSLPYRRRKHSSSRSIHQTFLQSQQQSSTAGATDHRIEGQTHDETSVLSDKGFGAVRKGRSQHCRSGFLLSFKGCAVRNMESEFGV